MYHITKLEVRICYSYQLGVKELWQYTNRSRGRSPRERFVYIAIIPWQSVDMCYISCLIGSIATSQQSLKQTEEASLTSLDHFWYSGT